MTIITNYFRHYTSPRVFHKQSLGKCILVRHKLQRFSSYGWYLTSAEHIICLGRFFSFERSRKVSSNRSTCIGTFLPLNPDDSNWPSFWNALFEGHEEDIHTHSKQKLSTQTNAGLHNAEHLGTLFFFFRVTSKVVSNDWIGVIWKIWRLQRQNHFSSRALIWKYLHYTTAIFSEN